MLEAVIFDFDGVIMDTEMADVQAWRVIYGRYGLEFPLALWQQNIGSHNVFSAVDYLAAQVGVGLDKTAVADEFRTLDEQIIRTLPVLPGVRQRMAEARQLGLKLAIASSSPANWLNYHLPRLGLLLEFDAVRTCTDVDGRKKPDPAVYMAACAAVGVSPAHALAIEDSMHGVTAAKAAGMWCVAVPNEATATMDFSAADWVVSSLADFSLQTVAAAYSAH